MTEDIDVLLSAFIDDELSPEAKIDLSRRLATDTVLAGRLQALRNADAEAIQLFEGMLDEPVPMELLRRLRAPADPPRSGWWTVAVAASIGLVVGLAAVLGIQTRNNAAANGWAGQVAAYHRVYQTEGRHLVEVGADESAHIMAWLGGKIGVDFQIPDLTSAGLDFRGARLLVAEGAPVAQLVYANASGAVLALCLTPRPGTPDEPMQPKPFAGLDAVVWREAGAAMVLIGPEGAVPYDAIARSAATQLALSPTLGG